MADFRAEVAAVVAQAMTTNRRLDTGRDERLEDLARTEVRRYLDRAGLGWSMRQMAMDQAESDIANFRQRMG